MNSLFNFFAKGLKNTVLLKNNGGFSHNGPWISLATNTVLDQWYINDFISAEYTISIDLDSKNKEIIKILVIASAETAGIVEYARTNTNIDLVSIDALVNNSTVSIIVKPTITKILGAKMSFTAQYFQNQANR